MFIKGEALHGSHTLGFSISGERGNWSIRVTAPGGVVTSDETTERTWFPLFSELLSTAFESAHRRRLLSAGLCDDNANG
jgi:hypothetical protein